MVKKTYKTRTMKTTKELKLKYPKCYKPLHRLKLKKIIGYKTDLH